MNTNECGEVMKVTELFDGRIIAAGLIIVCLALIAAGCANYSEPDIDDVGKSVESELHSKYGIKATVVGSRESSNGGGPFSPGWFFFDLRCDKGDFTASTDLDGKNMEDNYAKILFGGDVEREFQSIADTYPSLNIEYNLMQWLSQETWDSWEDYVRSDSVRHSFEVYGSPSDAYAWMKDMDERGYPFVMTLHYDGGDMGCDNETAKMSYDEFAKSWKLELARDRDTDEVKKSWSEN